MNAILFAMLTSVLAGTTVSSASRPLARNDNGVRVEFSPASGTFKNQNESPRVCKYKVDVKHGLKYRPFTGTVRLKGLESATAVLLEVPGPRDFIHTVRVKCLEPLTIATAGGGATRLKSPSRGTP